MSIFISRTQSGHVNGKWDRSDMLSNNLRSASLPRNVKEGGISAERYNSFEGERWEESVKNERMRDDGLRGL